MNQTVVQPNEAQLKILSRWRVSTFWVMLIGYIGYYIGRGNLSVALPLLSQTFGYTNTQLGIILTVSELAYALGKFTTGPLADKLGGKRIFLIGMFGAIIFNVAFPLVRGLFLFTLIWSLCRFFLSMGWGGIIKTIGEWYEHERNGTIMGVISVNFQFGSVLASLFCGYLISIGVGWQGLFYYPAGVMTLVFVWSYFCSKATPQDVIPNVKFGKNASEQRSIANFQNNKTQGFGIILSLLKLEVFRRILVFSFVIHLLRSIFMYWTPKFLVDLGMGNVNAAFTSAVFPLLGCMGTIFIGWYTDKYAKNDRARLMWIMLCGLMLSLLVIAALIPSGLKHQNWIVVMLGVGGFCLYGPYSMSAGALSLDIAGAEGAGSATGIIDGIGYIAGAFASWIAGYISDEMGWSKVFIMLAGFSVLTILAAYSMSRGFQKIAPAKNLTT